MKKERIIIGLFFLTFILMFVIAVVAEGGVEFGIGFLGLSTVILTILSVIGLDTSIRNIRHKAYSWTTFLLLILSLLLIAPMYNLMLISSVLTFFGIV